MFLIYINYYKTHKIYITKLYLKKLFSQESIRYEWLYSITFSNPINKLNEQPTNNQAIMLTVVPSPHKTDLTPVLLPHTNAQTNVSNTTLKTYVLNF